MKKCVKVKKKYIDAYILQKLKQRLLIFVSKIMTSFLNKKITTGCFILDKIKSDPKYFFSYAKKHKTVKKVFGPLTDPVTKQSTDITYEMSDILSKQCSSAFSTQHLNVVPNLCRNNKKEYLCYYICTLSKVFDNPISKSVEFTVSMYDVAEALDLVHPWGQTCCESFFSKILLSSGHIPVCCYIYRFCLNVGSFPQNLNDAVVVSTYWGGHGSMPQNYLLISLTCYIMMVIERIVAQCIFDVDSILPSKRLPVFCRNHPHVFIVPLLLQSCQ